MNSHHATRRNAQRGFATATVVVVIALVVSTSLWAFQESLTGRVVANARLFQARGAIVAGIGLLDATQRLRMQPAAAVLEWQLQPSAAVNERVAVSARLLATDRLPAGFSAGRFVDHHHEIASTATSGMNAHVAQTMGLAVLVPADFEEDPPGCPLVRPVPLRVRIGTAPPVDALLTTGDDPTLRITDRAGRELWSAGAGIRSLQHLFEAGTRITGSVAVADIDSDGVHDRIYAGDHAGFVWRVDLHNGDDAEHFASGGVFADLRRAGDLREFEAAPDLSRSIAAGRSWLNIAIGTAGSARHNRLFVLRDHAFREQWSDADFLLWAPLLEADLQSAEPGPEVDIVHGHVVDLGAAQVFTPPITTEHRLTAVVAETPVSAATGCRTRVAIRSFDVEDGSAAQTAPFGVLTAGDGIRATVDRHDPQRHLIRCLLRDTTLPQCSGFVSARRTWWRREDVD